MNTPLFDAIRGLADASSTRFHIPGHKGKNLFPNTDFFALDFTEITPTGNLYEGGEPFQQAQQLWADTFEMEHAQFLTGGSTQGVYSGLTLCTQKGDHILLDRGSHRSAYHISALRGLTPHYLQRTWLENYQVTSVVDPHHVKQQLEKHPNIKAVFITSPTYYGFISDIPTIAEICHQHGAKLVVDAAHAPHFPWLQGADFGKADVVTVSAHKTLPALGQGAVLLTSGFPPREVGEVAALYGTSSPSYPILCSIDYARGWMDEIGGGKYNEILENVEELRKNLPTIPSNQPIDPLRLTILTPNAKKLAQMLEEQGIYFEMGTSCHLVAVVTGLDDPQTLTNLQETLAPFCSTATTLPDLAPPTTLPTVAISLEHAFYAPKKFQPLHQSVGEIAASNVAPYPPGVPVVAMGERISQEIVDYLEKIGYNTQQEVAVVT